MKLIPHSVLFMLLFLALLPVRAQIVITAAMMPSVGDTVVYSHATAIGLPDPTLTGINFSWDYSALQSLFYSEQSFVHTNQTPQLYQFIFNPLVANLASPIPASDFFGDEITEAYIFYRRTIAEFVCPGMAVTIAGVPVPLKYNQPERLFKFPLSINSQPDSSFSEVSFTVPSYGHISITKKRKNKVDGWGTLITPYGTFNTLRIKSEVYEKDSLFIESAQEGFSITRNYIEYKWMAVEHPVPVLMITSEAGMLTAQYIDKYPEPALVVSIESGGLICPGQSALLSASVEGGKPPYSYQWNTGQTTASINVWPEETTEYSVVVSDAENANASAGVTVGVVSFEHYLLGDDLLLCTTQSVVFELPDNYQQVAWLINENLVHHGNTFVLDSTMAQSGPATLKVEYVISGCQASDQLLFEFQICLNMMQLSSLTPLKIFPNPASSTIVISSSRSISNPVVSIYDASGIAVKEVIITGQMQDITLEISSLKPGIYMILIRDDHSVYTGKFLKY
jgi:hypothetical protein